jgi:hypothetical protein
MPIPSPVSPPDDSLPSGNVAAGPGLTQIVYEVSETNTGEVYPIYPPNMWRLEELTATATVSIDTPACVRADATAAAVTVTLNSSLSNSLKMMHIMKTDSTANNVIVALPAGDTLYGAAGSLTLATQYKSVTLLAVNNVNVSGWHIIATT